MVIGGDQNSQGMKFVHARTKLVLQHLGMLITDVGQCFLPPKNDSVFPVQTYPNRRSDFKQDKNQQEHLPPLCSTFRSMGLLLPLLLLSHWLLGGWVLFEGEVRRFLEVGQPYLSLSWKWKWKCLRDCTQKISSKTEYDLPCQITINIKKFIQLSCSSF